MGITEFILETAKQQFLQEGMEQGIEKGMEQGMEKGKEAAAETIARNMLQKGVDIRFIQETTSLSLQRLQEIQKNVA